MYLSSVNLSTNWSGISCSVTGCKTSAANCKITLIHSIFEKLSNTQINETKY